MGITPGDQAKLFKPGVPHTTRGTANEEGSGLGLIICKEMVERNGGRIWLESQVGQGTSVSFTVPRSEEIMGDPQPHPATLSIVEVENKAGAEVLIPPPAEELDMLLKLIQHGNLPAIKQQGLRLEQLDEQYKPFARKLQKLAGQFDEDGLLALLKQSQAYRTPRATKS